MEQSETVVAVIDKDAEIRKLLEEKREERKQKLLARLGRNLSNPPSVSSWEALTGTLRTKKAPTNTNLAKPKETVSITKEKATRPKSVSSWEALKGSLKNKTTTTKAIPVQPNEAEPVKLHATAKPGKGVSVKRTLSFGQTATSLKRTNIANSGVTLKRSTSFKSVPNSTKKPAAPQVSQSTQVQKQKLTVPCSPNFSNRTNKQPPAAIKPQPVTAAKSVMVSKMPASTVPKQFSHIVSSSPKAVDNGAQVGAVTKRKSSSWMIPLTPERKSSPSKAVSSTQHTPNIKPFVRKSFSEARAVPIRSTQINRSVSTVSMNRPPSTLPRKSVAPSTLGKESSRRSVWSISKEPSEKEKVQQWLEKRGRSVASCRHLGCLGHDLKDFKVPDPKSANVNKSIRINRPTVDKSTENDANGSPQLKRKSSVMNTTFEKEDEEERMLTPPPPPDFDNNAAEDEEQVPPNSSVLNVTFEKEDDNQEEHNLPLVSEAIEADSVANQLEETDKFHTPTPENKRDSTLDLTDLKEGRVEALMETISALFQEPVYPEAKIESWLNQSEAAFPAVKTTALYWDIKARLEERRGNTMEALDIYSQALESKTESLDTMKQFFDNFLLRIGSNMPTGQRTPLLKSLGLETPMIRQSRRLTVRRPLLDSAQAFNSTTVKYELKLKQVFDTVGQQLQENNSPSRKKKAMKTPMKFNAASNTVSVASEVPFQLLATPVRRSMRPKSGRSMVTLDEQTFYVTDLDQLSPTTKAKAVLRENKALTTDL